MIKDFFKRADARYMIGTSIFFLGIIIFAGSLIMFALGIAPAMFSVLPTKDLAGMANQAVLKRMTFIQAGGLLFMAGGLFTLQRWANQTVQKSMWFVLGLIVVLFVLYAIVIQQTMFGISAGIPTFDNTPKAFEHALEQFRSLHRLYSFLASFATLLSFAAMILHIYAVRYIRDEQ